VNSNLFERTGRLCHWADEWQQSRAKIIDRISVFTFEGKE